MVQQNDRTLSQLALTTIASFWQQLYDDNTTAVPNTNHHPTMMMMMVVYDLVRTYHSLHEPVPVANAIQQLLFMSTTTTTISSSSQQQQQQLELTALQIAFDLVDTGDQTFCQQVAETLRANRPSSSSSSEPTSSSTVSATTTQPPPLLLEDVYDHIFHILTGGFVGELILSFRHRHSQADMKMMETLKLQLEDRSSGSHRNSILHTTTIVTHAYLYAGTTNDTFLRNHLDWMKKASHWSVIFGLDGIGSFLGNERCNILIPFSLPFLAPFVFLTGPSLPPRHHWV
jgi:hypothetical protein